MKTIRTLTALTLLAGTSLVHADPPAAVNEAEKEAAPTKPAAPELSPEETRETSSYGFGYRNGSSFSQQTARFGLTSDDIDRNAFIRGFFDAFGGGESAIDEEKVNTALRLLQENIQEREKAIGEHNLAAGEKFLAENGKREGVITTESGLQYEILTKGEGDTYQKPEGSGPDRTQFMIQYKGTLTDGTEFDSSEGKTVPMGINTVPGFREALTTMPTGSTWKLFLKPDLAYGPQRRSAEIGPNATLIFELTLEEIKTPPAPPAARRPTAVSPPIRVPLPSKDGEKPPGEGGKKDGE
jgi:FKBP-type peptidyl-prolyl cis-trans isomerase